MNKAYAESVADVGRLPLRRRDRAAMVLALECVRWPGNWHDPEGSVGCAGGALGYGGPVCTTVDRVLGDASHALAWERGSRTARLLRARLALLLRVLLRVNDGTGTLVSGCRKQRRGMPCTCWDGRVRPLWLEARAHG